MQATLSDVQERDRKYAWDYFQLHSSQRMASFNFYVTLSTALLAGASGALQPSVNLVNIALVLSIVLVTVSFVFWKLDGRNKLLIKNSEEALREIEKGMESPNSPTPAISLFRYDEQAVMKRRAHRSLIFWRNYYSYSDVFNLVFILFGMLGTLGIVLCIDLL